MNPLEKTRQQAMAMNQPAMNDPMSAFSMVHWPRKELAGKGPVRAPGRSKTSRSRSQKKKMY